MKVLLDMNLPPRWAEILSDSGIESMHWHEIGAHDASDVEIMAYAREHNYIVITCDLDFSTILSVSQDSKPSVVQIRATCFQIGQVPDIIAVALQQNVAELEKGAILSLDLKRTRLRVLPMR